MKRALIFVDIQNDFLPDGALAVSSGDETIHVANHLIAQKCFDLIIATADWHPANHKSFASQYSNNEVGDVIELNGLNQMLWPDHCIQESYGAELSRDLMVQGIDKVVKKGLDRETDSYSGFFDNGRRNATELEGYLRDQGITSTYIMGLATDYCVKFTALDSASLGFETHLILDGCRGVNIQPDDVDNAVNEMRQQGIEIVLSKELEF